MTAAQNHFKITALTLLAICVNSAFGRVTTFNLQNLAKNPEGTWQSSSPNRGCPVSATDYFRLDLNPKKAVGGSHYLAFQPTENLPNNSVILLNSFVRHPEVSFDGVKVYQAERDIGFGFEGDRCQSRANPIFTNNRGQQLINDDDQANSVFQLCARTGQTMRIFNNYYVICPLVTTALGIWLPQNVDRSNRYISAWPAQIADADMVNIPFKTRSCVVVSLVNSQMMRKKVVLTAQCPDVYESLRDQKRLSDVSVICCNLHPGKTYEISGVIDEDYLAEEKVLKVFKVYATTHRYGYPDIQSYCY